MQKKNAGARPLHEFALMGWLLAVACGGGGEPAADSTTLPPGPPSVPPAATFPEFEVRADTGIDAAHTAVSGYWLTGQAWGDYDGDGWVDLYVTNQAGGNTLYHNLGDGSFEVSALSNAIAMPGDVSGGAVFVDFDNDGWRDLYVLNNGPNVLWHNDRGLGFSDVTARAGIGDGGAGSSAAFGDYDGDGFLDCYVVNWACTACRDLLEGMRDRFYRNRGDGTFVDVTHLLGQHETRGFGFGVGFVDYDDDGDLDIYLVNDKGYDGPDDPNLPMPRNVLWRNDGAVPTTGQWVFRDVSRAAGADLRIDGMGLAVGDFDNDRRLDVVASSDRLAAVLRNRGDGTFENASVPSGIEAVAQGWGTFFADLDNDGYPDLYVAVYGGTCRMFENRRDGTFRDVSAASKTDDPRDTIGAAYADFDRDGWIDFVVGNRHSGYSLYRNRGLTAGRWLGVRLEGGGGVNRDAVGARVELTTTNGVTQTQEVACGSSIGSSHDLQLHFGLADAEVQELTIRWPDGLVESFTGIAADQEWRRRHP